MKKITKNDLLIDYTLKNFTKKIENDNLINVPLDDNCYSRRIKLQTKPTFLANIIKSVEVIADVATQHINEAIKEIRKDGGVLINPNMDVGTFRQLSDKPVYYNIYEIQKFSANAGDAKTLEEVEQLLDNDKMEFKQEGTGVYVFEFLISYRSNKKLKLKSTKIAGSL